MRRTILIALILALLFSLQPISANACEGGCDSQTQSTSSDERIDEHYYQ